ncbi:hypothetical protein ONE63_011369 [Megalurothrips usitatus]|uniref:Uncharacterized protein n=1 Tax=Megalurothrips usitatus TaxID=439358 RepID=A0AAV7WZI0_9NEOP|nr:hypothetical protein ONE63_011369 [Megalurothrips usitatus]
MSDSEMDMVQPSNEASKKSSQRSSSYSYDLDAVLKSAGGAGELLENVYKSQGSLNDSNRSSLAKIIINYETSGDFNKRLSTEQASVIASKIVEKFPSELLSTWYRTEQRSNGTGKIVKGRIMRRFYTQRKSFRKLGVLIHSDESDTDEETVDDVNGNDEDASNSQNEALTWLQNLNISPGTRVLSAWQDTSKKRLKELQTPVRSEPAEEPPQGKRKRATQKKVKSSALTVTSYTQQFPQIGEPQGWSLLEIDFEYLQKSSILKMDTTYEKLEKFVLNKLQKMDSDVLFDDFHLKSQSERSALIFLSLSRLFPVSTVATHKKKSWRPSRQEMTDSFLLQVNSYGDLNTQLEIRQKKLEQFNVTAQPLAVIVKEKEKNNVVKYKCLVKYDNFEYTGLESPLKAVDLTFKSYHALHAAYPVESEAMWFFLQKGVYQFTSKWDKHYDIVEILVKEFHKFEIHLKKVHNCSSHDNSFVTKNLYLAENEDSGLDSSVSTVDDEMVNDVPDVSMEEFELSYGKSVEVLVAKLYKNPSIPRNFVQTLIEDFDLFLSGGFIEILESKVMNALKAANVSESCISEINFIFTSIKDPFKGLKTDYKRMEHFKSNDYYVPPVTFTISESRPKLFQTKDGPVIKHVKTTGQYVPFRHVLKNVFELPGALSATLDYVNFLKNASNNTVISNVIQGDLWKSKVAHFKETDIVFPVDFYYDDVEPNADLGPHSDKLGAGYLMLPTLPPACQSKLENIFLVLLIEADDRKSCVPGKVSYNAEVFKPVITEFNYVESKGILCNTHDLGERRVFFVLNVVRGDNLGVHGIMGFAKGFTANFPCTICRAPKLLTQSMTKEDESLLRTVTNYAEDVAKNNLTLTGIKEACVFNSVKSFHVAQSQSVDIMHDGPESVSHYILIPVIGHCIDSKYFSLELLNSRLYLFDYGPSDSANKPVAIPSDFRTRHKLKGTAREIMTLVRLLGVIVGDLVPSTDKFWQLYLLHRDIMEICHAKELPLAVPDELELKIHEHHSLYLELCERDLPPKFHFFTHYKRKIIQSGPVVHMSSMRGESKHREVVTRYAHAITSRRNLPMSASIKQLLTMCVRFIAKTPLLPPMLCGPGEVIELEDHLHYLGFRSVLPKCVKSSVSVQRVNWVDCNGIMYKPKMVLVMGVSKMCNFKFGKIIDIFIISDRPLFICERMVNLGYDDHVAGFEVSFSNKYSCVFLEDLLDPFPLYDFLMSSGTRFVVLKHYL